MTTSQGSGARSLRVVFAGTPEFAAVALKALIDDGRDIVAVLTQPDRPAGRGRRLRPSPVKQLAERHGHRVLQPRSLRRPEIQATLGELAPDLIVVVAYGLLLPRAVLAIPRHGCLNIHASLLPRWRGAAPIQRAILAGDSESGVTIMQMDEGLDTGKMLERRVCAIRPDDTAGTLHDRLAALGADALRATLGHIVAGDLHPEPQDERLATYAGKIDKAEAELDWRAPAVALERKVRAFDPWPVAFTTLGDYGRIRVWRAAALPGGAGSKPAPLPGAILGAGRDGIDIATGDGILRLLEIQMAGGRRIPVGDFLNAHPLAASSGPPEA